MVTPDNHNKYYRMIPNGDIFTVEFGRVGAGCQTASYPICQWNKKYNEKLRKGYTDQTDLTEDLIQIKRESDKYQPIGNQDIAEIVDRLQRMAKQAIRDNYTISTNKVTSAMIRKAQDIIVNLLNEDKLERFNKLLISLFMTIPRKMGKVSDHLATNKNDFAKIVQREQDLLDVMNGQVVQHQTEENNNRVVHHNETILDVLQIDLAPATFEDIEKIKYALGTCKNKFYNAWKAKNVKTQNAFDRYICDNNIYDTKLLWHGSRNENWWSIINSGLVLKPTNAIITGKMFGYGTYFATKAQKSLGYTSLKGSCWASGDSSYAFMGLYDVAYGKPYDAYSFDHRYRNLNYESLQRLCPEANCLHAHAGSMLRNDEIIVYREEQTTIKYLVELR